MVLMYSFMLCMCLVLLFEKTVPNLIHIYFLLKSKLGKILDKRNTFVCIHIGQSYLIIK